MNKPMQAVTVDRTTGNGKYADVIDVCDRLSERFGSAANALVQIARESPIYQDAVQELAKAQPESASV